MKNVEIKCIRTLKDPLQHDSNSKVIALVDVEISKMFRLWVGVVKQNKRNLYSIALPSYFDGRTGAFKPLFSAKVPHKPTFRKTVIDAFLASCG